MSTIAPVAPTRSAPRLFADSPRCQNCGQPFQPVDNFAEPVGSAHTTAVAMFGATHCRQCRNARHAWFTKSRWLNADGTQP